MAYTNVTHESWGSRLKKALSSIVVGLVLLVAGCVLLFWNEGRAVKTAQALDEGASVVVSVPDPAQRDAALEGKLVHVQGRAVTDATLQDAEFGLAQPAMRLVRSVEYYQWVEHEESHTEKNVGGSTTTTTTYTYEKKWCDEPVSSHGFAEPGHTNTVAYSPQGGQREWLASPVCFGAYELSRGQVGRVGTLVAVENPQPALPEALHARCVLEGGWLYIAALPPSGEAVPPVPAAPKVGDVRVTWSFAPREADVSLVATQRGKSFAPYVSRSSGYEVDLVEDGLLGAEQMFARAHKRNTVLTWVLRAAGSFLIFFGLLAMLHILSVLGDVIPFLGTLVGGATAGVAFVGAFVLALGTIAVAWFWYRPLLAAVIGLVALSPMLWRAWRKLSAA